MKCLIGVGSNLENPKENLESAAKALFKISNNHFRASPIYKTPALLPPNAPADWDKPYHNAVIEIDWSGTAIHLFNHLKSLEETLGRTPAERWAPRIIDLDLLTYGNETVNFPSLQIPHPRLFERSFVLDPMKDLCPSLILPGTTKTVLSYARNLKTHQPLIMGIVNVTPDSFSDGGENISPENLRTKLLQLDYSETHILDFGAESTRPGATRLSEDEEWSRLKPALEITQEFYRGRMLLPVISVDTYKAGVADRALELGANWINDVSGLGDPNMLSVLKDSDCHYVLMHNLGVPTDPQNHIPESSDPVRVLKEWFEDKLNLLIKNGISIDRIVFDVGIGFGKTTAQSVQLIRRIDEFSSFPVRILVGHSRKSFMKAWGLESHGERDQSTLFLSRELASKGVDILRVHDFKAHMRAFS